MGDFDVLSYCRQLRSLRPPPYECPVADCDKVYTSMTGFQYHLAHIQHSSPIPPLDLSTPAKETISVDETVSNKTKSKKRKGRRVTFTTLSRTSQPEIVEPATPVHLSKMLCEVEVANNKVIRFNTEDHLPVLSTDELIKQKKEIKIPSKTTAILSSLLKCKEAVRSLPQAAFKEVDNYNILNAPPMPNSYIRFIEKSVEELDTEVEYDMDEEDAAWLQIMNEQRESSGLVGVSIESFELLMDRLEKESYFLVQMNKEVDSSLAVIDDEAVCSICLDGECQNSNVILFCDMCNLAVHQDCYGVPYIPEGQWLCRRCLHSPSCMVDCVLCPNNCGAFKQTDRGLWAHVVCSLWIPEVRFANTVFLEPIDSIETIPTARWKLTCYICKQRGVGACIQCHKSSCYAAFHVTCAQQAGLYMKMETISNDMSIGDAEPGTVLVQKIAFCDAHAPADYLNENRGRQSPEEKLNNARRLLAKNRSAAPVISIPTIPPDRVTEIANLLSVPKKSQFVQRLIAYWTLKRQFRNGVPLLRRLQTSQTSNVSRREEPLPSQENEDDLTELYRQLKYWQALRQDLERVRLLCELIRKRERLKKEVIRQHGQYVLKSVWPFNFFLHSVLQQLITKDAGQIFIEPVDQNEVPDYGDIVKHPMDLQTMEIKINKCEYNSLEAFESDFNLMISNCLAYNSKETVFYKAGIKMRDQGGTVLRTAKRDLKVLELDPVSMTLAKISSKNADTTAMKLSSKTKEEIRDDKGTEIDCELKEICNPSNTMGDDDRMCKLLQLADKCRGGRQNKRARMIKTELTKLRAKIDMEGKKSDNDEDDTVNEPEKTEVEITCSKRNVRKRSEKLNENFVFKKPETPSKSTSPVASENNRNPRNSIQRKSSTDLLDSPLVRRTRQSINQESFKSYRSSKKTDTEDDSPSDEESSYLDSDSDTNSSSSSGSGSSTDGSSSSGSSSDSESEIEEHKKRKKDEFAQLQLVWAKCRGYPWYPALIIDPNMPPGHLHNGIPVPSPPSEVLSLASNYKELVYLVLFFDSKRTWQWLPRNKLEPLGVTQELDDIKLIESKKPTDRKSVRKAYMEALVYKTDPIIPSSSLRRSSRS